MQTTPAFTVRDLCVTYPTDFGNLNVLERVSFQVAAHEFIAVIGPSGCGKSTLLRSLAGLLVPAAGIIDYGYAHPPKFGMVFQDATLLPWLTVLQNIMLPLEMARIPQKERLEKAQTVVNLVQLGGFENSWPYQLSGGMAMRVAIARALVQDPDLLLLDEPFASLDALTREEMSSELSRIWQAKRNAVVLVTHSIGEAIFLADRVIVLGPRPGTVRMDMKVNLPRPREEYMRYTPQFSKISWKLKESLDLDILSFQ